MMTVKTFLKESGNRVVGKTHLKKDALERTLGKSQFGDDLYVEGMLYGKALRSEVIHARIKKIDISQARQAKGVVAVITHEDIPGDNRVGIIKKDEPVLAGDKVRRHFDALALVAAETEEDAEHALSLINVELEELPSVTDPCLALESGAPIVQGDSNICLEKRLVKGNIDKAWEHCECIIENSYETTWAAHMFIEPHVTLAAYENNILTFWASTQNPHFDRREVAWVLNLPQNRVRGISLETGAGFGGKLDIGAQCHASLLSFITGRPVKVNHEYEETMRTCSKRHPYRMKFKTGATAEGMLLAMEAEMIIDTGPYASYGPGVLTRALIHSSGPYEIPNIEARGKLVYTNNPMSGAMRGFGVPQVAVAHEAQMDELAEALEINPWEIRAMNALKNGSLTSTGQVLCGAEGNIKVMEAAKKKAGEILGREY